MIRRTSSLLYPQKHQINSSCRVCFPIMSFHPSEFTLGYHGRHWKYLVWKEKRERRELKLEVRRNAMCNTTLKPERSELDVRTVVAVLKSITSWCHRARKAYPALLFPAHLTKAVARSRRLFKVPFPPFFAGLLPSLFADCCTVRSFLKLRQVRETKWR